MIDSKGGGPTPQSAEVWLRGNVRPVLAAAGGVAVIAVALVALFAALPVPAVAWLVAGAMIGLVMISLVTLGYAAAQPRLVWRGDRLMVRVSPAAVATVPLEVVECFFAGSNPLDASGAPTCGEHAAFRVGTLVVRIAERAHDYRSGKTFRPWVVWEDGYLVIDGRWCEPLSPAKARDLGGRLAAAKRVESARGSG